MTPELGRRGRRLWEQTRAAPGPEWKPRELVLLEEACRTADRLDTLDRILRGDDDGWMRIRVNEDATEVTVNVTNVLAEVRQQQTALKQMLAELRQSRSETASAPRRGQGGQRRTSGTGAASSTQPAKGGVVADLASWVAANRPASAG